MQYLDVIGQLLLIATFDLEIHPTHRNVIVRFDREKDITD